MSKKPLQALIFSLFLLVLTHQSSKISQGQVKLCLEKSGAFDYQKSLDEKSYEKAKKQSPLCKKYTEQSENFTDLSNNYEQWEQFRILYGNCHLSIGTDGEFNQELNEEDRKGCTLAGQCFLYGEFGDHLREGNGSYQSSFSQILEVRIGTVLAGFLGVFLMLV
ncbi:hypothetical protein PPERSA_07729 [Pseudocohnilembus persalinus]|uniref:Transmembrane protein n=1 Tax=Pseudocohnilembus persalinus TaxID=266149 RepID=A0A0V0R9P4_PSEPJ|nr:hypothetical protein PPERSA_07729 [Pseudocohnilembus persalinus]|eukprot:KRX11204.1 hypothetical protein PPERSA_07729 [Pseudocohnilembus persalinus]